MIPEQIQSDIDALKEQGWSVSGELMGDGFVHVIFDQFDLPAGFTPSTTKLLIKVPQSYPNGHPDMFWVDEGVRLSNGNVPEKADQLEQIHEQTWRRFSWHPSKWNPGEDTIRTFIEFVRVRFNRKQ